MDIQFVKPVEFLLQNKNFIKNNLFFYKFSSILRKITIVFLFSLSMCSHKTKENIIIRPTTQKHSTRKKQSKSEKTNKIINKKATSKSEKLKNFMKKPKTKIFVGGCRDACREPDSTFANFISAIKYDPSGKKIIPFLNTAILKFNGKNLGAHWAELWKQGKWEERQKSIEQFSTKFLSWYKKLTDQGEIDDARRNSKIEETSEKAIVYFKHPYISGDLTKRIWTIKIKPRGLEWLIFEINQF